VILVHLFILGAIVLAAPSGPWPAPNGSGMMASGPPFAQNINEVTAPNYLRPLKMNHNYHFQSNRVTGYAVRLEVQLRDPEGNHLQTIMLPDPNASPSIQHRHSLMLEGLVPDQPVEAPTGETIAAPGQEAKTVLIWDRVGERELLLKRIPEHLLRDQIMRNGGVMRPSEWSLVLVRSYARHLCREHGAASAVAIRRTREPIHPDILNTPAIRNMEDPPAEMFAELLSNYGEVSR